MDTSSAAPLLDMRGIDFLSVLDRLDDGVMITDCDGTILFYNQTQVQIDGIPSEEAMGQKVTQIYELTRRTSIIMQSITHQASIKNKTFFYRTSGGKVVHSITSSYPLFSTDGTVNGAICFVKDYAQLQRSIPMPSREPLNVNLGNGTRFRFPDIIGSSQGLQKAITIAKKAADSASPIMIQGETGTGKELVAQAIHNQSPRREQKFVAVNCAAIPHDLLEGMLFGTSRGAFTGALDRPGLFELAHGSTIFLDELLSMPVDLQAKLLRALQDRSVRRLGSLKETPVDVKIISSLNQDPRAAIQAGSLRTDLYYRLGVVMVKLPALRQRLDTMEELIDHFIRKYNARLGTNVKRISREVKDLFTAYHWPGNIRELEHLIEGAMNMAGQDEVIGLQHFEPGLDCLEQPDAVCTDPAITRVFPPDPPPPRPESGIPENFTQSQKEREQTAIREAMQATAGNVTQAAARLGISRQVLHYKLKKFSFRRVDFMR